MIKISQDEVANFLKKNKKKWFSSTEIANELGLRASSVIKNCGKLRRNGFIDYKHDPIKYRYIYRFKNVQ